MYTFEPDASRPYFHFLFQVSRERQREKRFNPDLNAEKINELAYEQVKKLCVKDNMGLHVGQISLMQWMHEFPRGVEDQAPSYRQDTPTGPKL